MFQYSKDLGPKVSVLLFIHRINFLQITIFIKHVMKEGRKAKVYSDLVINMQILSLTILALFSSLGSDSPIWCGQQFEWDCWATQSIINLDIRYYITLCMFSIIWSHTTVDLVAIIRTVGEKVTSHGSVYTITIITLPLVGGTLLCHRSGCGD